MFTFRDMTFHMDMVADVYVYSQICFEVRHAFYVKTSLHTNLQRFWVFLYKVMDL